MDKPLGELKRRLVWRKPDVKTAGTRGLMPLETRGAFELAVMELGFPEIPDAQTPEEEALVMLHIAAELEHALLVEYLYAAWSLGPDTGDMSRKILAVAKEEMAHLITVQNLIRFVGGTPYLERQDASPQPDLDPFPFSLEPFSTATLERFLIAEMPPIDALSPDQQVTMQKIIGHQKDSLHRRLHRVGLLYAKLYWLFQPSDDACDPWKGLVQIADLGVLPHGWHVSNYSGAGTANTLQASRDEQAWKAPYLGEGIFETINSFTDALNAIYKIAAQGEGLIGTNSSSHFSVFWSLYSSLPNYPPSAFLNVASNPFTAPESSPDPTVERNRITHPVASILCDLFDTRYKIMLVSLRLALELRRDNPDERSLRDKYIAWTLEEMVSSLRSISGRLLKLPSKINGQVSDPLAAPPFRLDGLVMPSEVSLLKSLLQDLHANSDGLLRSLLGGNADPATRLIAQNIQAVDQDRYSFA